MRVSNINASKNMAMRIAYMFSHPNNWPAEVDGCKLWPRFALCLVPWIVLSFIVWIIMGVIGGVVMLVSHAVAYIVFGLKFVYDSDAQEGPFFWAPGREALSRLLILCYEKEKVEHLAFIEEFTDSRSPLSLLFILALVVVVLVLAKLFFWDLVPFVSIWLFDLVYDGAITLYETFNWWGMWGSLAVALILAWSIVRRVLTSAWQNFSSSESGKLVFSLYEDWREKNCTRYKVI